mgnify:CR=1 FL=1
MRDLTVDTADFAFKARLEQGKDGEHTFAQLSIRIGDVIFGDPDAWSLSGTIARLSRGLRLLHGRVTELAYHLHHFSDDRHANLSYEQGHAAATATIADALMAELSELPGAASSTQVPPGVAPEPASQAEQ